MNDLRTCKLGLWNSTIPGINFDEHGVSNFAKMQLSLMEQYPRGEVGMNDWLSIVNSMKQDGKNGLYDYWNEWGNR
jgi:predicted oxidoreductase